MKTYVVLHNVRSAHNVGSIFRTADGAGVSKMFLTGYTPAPVDRFGREQKEILKTSLGATQTVPFEIVNDIGALLARLKEEEITTVAVEQARSAVDFKEFHQAGDTAYVFGNEVAGVPEEVYKATDAIIHIPMHGTKESLNVSVAVGVILFNRSR